jgi:NADPH:quinone reductase-like Zn-dependent oxidoreductase
MNFFMVFVFGLRSRKMIRNARKRSAEYSFLFVRPDGQQLAEIGEPLKTGSIRPVIDRVFPFDQAKVGLAYLRRAGQKARSSSK